MFSLSLQERSRYLDPALGGMTIPETIARGCRRFTFHDAPNERGEPHAIPSRADFQRCFRTAVSTCWVHVANNRKSTFSLLRVVLISQGKDVQRRLALEDRETEPPEDSLRSP